MSKVAVVIPCFRVSRHILGLLGRIGSEVDKIYVIDDCCPEGTGTLVERSCADARVTVLYHRTNQGVGGAVVTGYRRALVDGMDIVVKMDGDGQMDPSLIASFVQPIARGDADYVKGNRFFFVESLAQMPKLRLLGNAVLSFLTKISSGYWHTFDPTNGYTAIHATCLSMLPLHKLARRYFFESDLLFRLNTLRAVVLDVPMDARYGDEKSSLRIPKIILPFLWGNLRNFLKRIFYNYYLRNFSLASVELLIGIAAVFGGATYGLLEWVQNHAAGRITPPGTVMLAALPIILGTQLLLNFLNFEVQSIPHTPVQRLMHAQRVALRAASHDQEPDSKRAQTG